MKQRTSLIHPKANEEKTGGIVFPMHLSTVFKMDAPSSTKGFQYGRVGNPTRKVLEKSLADLNDAKFAAVFSSGSAAITAAFSLFSSDDEIVFHQELYEGTRKIIGFLGKFGLIGKFCDLNNPTEVKNIISANTKAIFFETPTNPTLQVINIEEIKKIIGDKKILLIVDNTLASPILQKPLLVGADIVLESLTKSAGGHSDLIGGVIATNKSQIFKKIKFIQSNLGAILSPFECFMLLRSLKTLPLRIEAQQNSALKIKSFLKKHPMILKVFFPNKIKRQMNSSGFMISFLIRGDLIRPEKFLARLKIITIGHSFGGAETLIQQPTTMMDLEESSKISLTDNFFRLSVGLENTEDIIADLNQALNI